MAGAIAPLKRRTRIVRLRALPLALVTIAVLAVPSAEPGAQPSPERSAANGEVRAEVGVFLLSLPSSSPFIETDSNEALAGFLEHYEASQQASPVARLAVTAASNLFAEQGFVEARGFVTSRRSRHANEYARTSDLWDVLEAEQFGLTVEELRQLSAAEREQRRRILFQDDARLRAVIEAVRMQEGLRLAGWIGAIDGSPLRHTPNFAWGDAIRIDTKRRVTFLGGDALGGITLRTGARSSLVAYAGPSFMDLRQRNDIHAYEMTNRTPDQNFMTLDEVLDADYRGAVVGGRVDIPIGGAVHLSASGDAGLYRLSGAYRGRQRTVLTSTTVDEVRADVRLRDTRLAVRTRIEVMLSVAMSEGYVVQAGAGFEHLSHVPIPEYARVGERFSDNTVHDGVRLSYRDAAAGFASVSVTAKF